MQGMAKEKEMFVILSHSMKVSQTPVMTFINLQCVGYVWW
jgi:hypothetical protein